MTMSQRRLGAVALAVVLLAGAACTSSKESSKSAAEQGATEQHQAGGYQATIRRTTDGVPHITATDQASAVFGQGWASGEDHACSLADQVVKVNSERAKWFGAGDKDANLNSDLGWLALGLRSRAETEYPQQPEDARQQVAAFVAGWNAYLAKTGIDNLTGWCKGQAWVRPISEVDLYTYARSITLNASGARLLDYMAKATPPATAATPATPAAVGTSTEAALADLNPDVSTTASNGWAIGADRSDNGDGMLLANPHFPWEGELRFWESQLTVPGESNIYGVQLLGLPGIGIGFNDHVAWTHTVSAGTRFTAYTVDLVPGEPTKYKYGNEVRSMTPNDVTVDVRQPDGTTTQVKRTLWSTHYGPVLDFPGVGWTADKVITYRDANIDNTALLSQYLGMDNAKSLDEFKQVHADVTGVPLFNTIAVSPDGRAWYADTSATPNLSKAAIAAYEASLASDPIASAAAAQRVFLLDGSDPLYEWVDEPGARSPGLVPYSKMPQTERSDYVFNANDSFWVPNADHLLTGDYSPLHGRQNTSRSPRTRENATVLRDTSASGPSGADGKFDLEELRNAALLDRGYTSRVLREAVVGRCTGAGAVDVPALTDNAAEVLPAATVDITRACQVLAGWDGTYNLDSVGAAVWREFITRYDSTQLQEAGALWATPFDATKPVDSPSGLAPAGDGGEDPVLVNLARAVQILDKAGVAADAKLGDLQFADRNGTRVPIHGGDNSDGTTNVVGWGSGQGSLEPTPTRGPRFAPRSSLTKDGYPINNGTSFIMTLQYGPDGPQAFAMLTYGETGDRSSPLFVSQTERFSQKNWRRIAYTEQAITTDPSLSEEKVSS